jgi:hypothetical protein
MQKLRALKIGGSARPSSSSTLVRTIVALSALNGRLSSAPARVRRR